MPQLGKQDWLIIVLAAVYVFLPWDIIPEIIAGPIGLTDDLGAVAVIMATLVRARNRDKADPGARGKVVKGEVVPPAE
jgi:uncharacterized membrane protein YkvA (DUF1232 family)